VRVIIVPRKDVAADALFLGLSSETRKRAFEEVWPWSTLDRTHFPQPDFWLGITSV